MRASTSIFGGVLLIAGLAAAQERCDAPSPGIFCNSTEILAYESADCSTYHVFLARGSDEPYPGRLGNLTSEICSGLDSCSFESVEYPAKSTAWGPNVWCDSAGKGAKAGQEQMKAYAEKCPDAKLILLGFSQGGAVAQDILGGGGGKVFACEQDINPAMDATTAPGSNIVAAVTFGAVVRSRNQNFTVGPGVDYDGQAPRTEEQLAGLNAYSSVLLDYCHYGDPMCAVGSNPPDVEAHLNYFVKHNEEVKSWVVKKAKSEEVKKPGESATESKTSSASSSATKTKATQSASATPVASGAATATVTDATQVAKQTGTTGSTGSTGAAGSLTVTVGHMTALALVVAAFL